MINFLAGLLFAVDVICAVLLIGIILIQQSKSGGGLGAISGGKTDSVFGAAAGNVITKTTVALAAIFLVTTLLLAFISKYEQAPTSVSEQLKQKDLATEEALESDRGAGAAEEAGSEGQSEVGDDLQAQGDNDNNTVQQPENNATRESSEEK
ncbi:MAG: preprotein translocase subunit SecG [Lentisphaeria bacterium]